MKVIGYVRVSTQNQAGEDKCGIDVQKEEIIKYCAEKGHHLVDIIVDVVSGAKLQRPGLNEIIYNSNKEYEAVIVYKTDRVSRKIEEYYYIKMILKNINIDIISINEDYSNLGPFAPLLESFIVFVAQMERENIKMRTMAGREARQKQGEYIYANIPHGYTRKNGKIVVDPYYAQAVIDTFKFRKEGLSLQKIADKLNQKKHFKNNGNPFSKLNVANILKNELFYRGKVVLKDGNIIEGKQEKLF